MNATPRAETNAIADGRATSDIIDPDAKARLAHELRTPLAAIHSLADVIAEERFGPR